MEREGPFWDFVAAPRIAFLDGDLRDAEGTVVATATATARVVRAG
jgi:hypothetical protein